MPTVGKQQYRTTDPQSQRLAYASSFSHKNEIAEPGYYSVFLDTYQVKAEFHPPNEEQSIAILFPKTPNPDLSSTWITACNDRLTPRWK